MQRVAAAEQKTKIRPLSKNNIGIFPAGNPAGNEYCYESVAECGPDVVDWPLMKRSTSSVVVPQWRLDHGLAERCVYEKYSDISVIMITIVMEFSDST